MRCVYIPKVENLRKQLGKLDERARSKEQELEDALAKLEAFYADYDNVMGDLQEVSHSKTKFFFCGFLTAEDLDSYSNFLVYKAPLDILSVQPIADLSLLLQSSTIHVLHLSLTDQPRF